MRKLIGKGFNRNATFKFRVSCPIHLAHATATNDGENFHGAKSGAGGQAQLCPTLMRESDGIVIPDEGDSGKRYEAGI